MRVRSRMKVRININEVLFRQAAEATGIYDKDKLIDHALDGIIDLARQCNHDVKHVRERLGLDRVKITKKQIRQRLLKPF